VAFRIQSTATQDCTYYVEIELFTKNKLDTNEKVDGWMGGGGGGQVQLFVKHIKIFIFFFFFGCLFKNGFK
jgi:hypothetical protein